MRGCCFFFNAGIFLTSVWLENPHLPAHTPPPPCVLQTKACQPTFSPNRVERKGNVHNKWSGSPYNTPRFLALSSFSLYFPRTLLPGDFISSSHSLPGSASLFQLNEVEISQEHVTGLCHCLKYPSQISTSSSN